MFVIKNDDGKSNDLLGVIQLVQGMDTREHMKEVQRLLGVVPQDIALFFKFKRLKYS